MTNKKLKLAAMSVALTACVAAQPMAAHAVEGPDSVEDNAAPQAEPAPVEGKTAEARGRGAKRKSRKSLFPRRTMRPRKMIRLPRSAPAPIPMISSSTTSPLRSLMSPVNPARRTRLRTPTAPM